MQGTHVTREKAGQSGYALLLVFLMAALIAIALYNELPRIAVEKQRAKEQLLIERGEQYKRAIQLFVRKFQRYPAKIEDLENTNNFRFLRKRYVDPMTGKDKWRLIHINGGVFTDSIVPKNKPGQGPDQGQQQASTNTFIGVGASLGGPTIDPSQQQVNTALQRRASDERPVITQEVPDQTAPDSDQDNSTDVGDDNNNNDDSNSATDAPGTATNAPGVSPQPPGVIPGRFPPGSYPPGVYPGQQPGVYPGQQAGVYPGQQPGVYPGQQPGFYPGQPGFNPALPNQPYGAPGQFPNQYPGGGLPNAGVPNGGQPSSGVYAAPSMGQQPNAPDEATMERMLHGDFQPPGSRPPPFPQQPGGFQQFGGPAGAAGVNPGGGFGQPASGFPQPGSGFGQPGFGQPGGFGQPAGGVPGAGGTQIGGGIAGVASESTRPAIKIYNERKKYSEWEFVYDQTKDRGLAGVQRGGGAPGTPAQTLGSIPGQQPGVGGPAGFGGPTPNGVGGQFGNSFSGQFGGSPGFGQPTPQQPPPQPPPQN